MRVKDLVGNDFKNIDVKKMEAETRMAVYRRKYRSLSHQMEIVKTRMENQIVKMEEKGLAFKSDSEQYKADGRNIRIGFVDRHVFVGVKLVSAVYGTFWCKDTPANQPAVKFCLVMAQRRDYLKNQANLLQASIKGTKSAMTRKRRWG